MCRDLTTSPAWWVRLIQDGSSAGGVAHAVCMEEEGSVTMAGSTFGLWGDTHAGSSDFIASKLDPEGTLIWTWKVNRLYCLQSCLQVVSTNPLLAAASSRRST